MKYFYKFLLQSIVHDCIPKWVLEHLRGLLRQLAQQTSEMCRVLHQ